MGSAAPPREGALPVEHEIKLAVPATFRMPNLLTVGPSQTERPARSVTVFWDTADLALAAWSCVLRYRSGEGWTVKLPDIGAGEALERPEVSFEGRPEEPPPAALALLDAFLRGRPVEQVARITTVRRRTVFGDGAARLELVDDRVRTDEAVPRAMRQLEVEVTADEGAAQRDEIVRRLVHAGARSVGAPTKYEWALGARRPRPEVDPPVLTPRATLRDAVRAALAASVVALVCADPHVRAGRDPEAIHEARVAVRRLRSDLRAFADVLDPAWTTDLRDELGRLGAALGAVRDREVLRARLAGESERLEDADVSSLLGLIDREIAEARIALETEMRGDRQRALLDKLVDAANAPRLAIVDGLALELLRPAIRRAWRRLRRAAKQARRQPADDALHRVRIAAKRLRYTSDALAPVFGKRAQRLARGATDLQDVLGEHQDAVVARSWLRDHVAADGTAGAYAVGELAALELIARDAAREHWTRVWSGLRRWRPAKWR